MGFLILSSGNKKTVVLQYLLETQKRMEGSNSIHLHELFFLWYSTTTPSKYSPCRSPSLTCGIKAEMEAGRVFLRSYKDAISFFVCYQEAKVLYSFPFLSFPAVVKLTVICNQYTTGANKLLWLLVLNPEATTACS